MSSDVEWSVDERCTSWNWGSGSPSGTVKDVKTDEATIESKKGNEIKKKGTEDNPA